MDLKEYFRDLDDKPSERAAANWTRSSSTISKLRGFPKPTIAMVNGWCFGGGLHARSSPATSPSPPRTRCSA